MTHAHISAPMPSPQPPAQQPGAVAPFVRPLSLMGAIRSEWIKASSLRSIRWSIAVSVVLGVAISLLIASASSSWAGSGDTGAAEYLRDVASGPALFLGLVFAVLGVFVFSSEYSSGMILSTLTAVPRRGLVITAKAIIVTLIAGVAALVCVAAGVGIGVMFLPRAGSVVFTGEVLSGLVGTVLYLVALALMACALAGLLRSTAGSITVVVALVFVAPLVLQMIGGITESSLAMQLYYYLPTALGDALGNGTAAADDGWLAAMFDIRIPGYWEALGALAAWVAVPMALAAVALSSRDAK